MQFLKNTQYLELEIKIIDMKPVKIFLTKIIPDYYCLTHPHQIYFETLAEHGLFGTIILFGILFYLMFRILKLILISKNYLQLGCLIYILVNFTPVLPSGSFFSDFNITLFWINFSIMFACDKKSNIFKINN